VEEARLAFEEARFVGAAARVLRVYRARMWIMVSGPYTAGAATEEDRQRNLDAMNAAALALFRAGHVPIVGVNAALPIVRVAGGAAAAYDEIMMPLAVALVDRCDACLRVGGASRGADQEADAFRAKGKRVYLSLDDVLASVPSGTEIAR
jgi:hypothetical protein